MTLQQRKDAFVALGERLAFEASAGDESHLIFRTGQLNKWFDPENVRSALDGIAHILEREALEHFVEGYDIPEEGGKTIGVIMAGNIPAVGFHDYFCVLLSGNKLQAKLSSQDNFLLREIHRMLVEIAPAFADKVEFAEQLKLDNVDGIIATGSDNSARYFEQYFSRKPHIIRKNRSSLAVLTGEETADDFVALGDDIFRYFGLGCRNISKLFVPEGYDFTPMLDQFHAFEAVIEHPTYGNNYTYYKSIYLVNKKAHLDTGFLLVTEEERMSSPVGVIFYETYKDLAEVKDRIEAEKDSIQCMVAKEGVLDGAEAFGRSQFPGPKDYADGVDTMAFLLGL